MKRSLQTFSGLAVAIVASLTLASCGGGGTAAVPTPLSPAGGSSNTASSNKMASAALRITLPAHATNPASSTKRSPQYVSSTYPSSIVISVVPADPAEASQWATLYGASGFTVCYNIYDSSGNIVTTNPGVTVTPGNPTVVSLPFPSPPGNDTFNLTQYSGVCGNQYTAPTPPPNTNNGNNILAQSPPLTVNIIAGQTNNINVALAECGTSSPCPNVTPNPQPAPTSIQLNAAVAAIYIGGATPAPSALASPAPILPIPRPLREQGAFVGNIGIPIPVVGLDSAGAVISGNPAAGSGALPNALTLTRTEVDASGTNHTHLALVDATTNSIVQNESAGVLTLHQLNALALADAPLGGAGNVGHPYVVVLTYDGSAATALTSATVTASTTLGSGAASYTSTSAVTITPQSAVFSASTATGASGYADPGAPYTSPVGILNYAGCLSGSPTCPGNAVYVTDGARVVSVGVGSTTITGATKLTGIAWNSGLAVPGIYVVDNGATLGSTNSMTATPSGVYDVSLTPSATFPLAVQSLTTGHYIGFTNPQGIAYVPSGYMYVAVGNNIIPIDPQPLASTLTCGATTCLQAEGFAPLLPSGSLSLGTNAIIGMTVDANGNLVVCDPGNNRIVTIALSNGGQNGTVSPTLVASGHAFVNLTPGPSAGTYYATDTSGNAYFVSNGTATSMNLPLASAAADGGIGTFALSAGLPSAISGPGIAYPTQGNTANFFGATPTVTSPYSLAPFNGTAIFNAPATVSTSLGLVNDTSFGSTGPGTFKAALSVAYIPSAVNASLTAKSLLVTDASGSVRTIVP